MTVMGKSRGGPKKEGEGEFGSYERERDVAKSCYEIKNVQLLIEVLR